MIKMMSFGVTPFLKFKGLIQVSPMTLFYFRQNKSKTNVDLLLNSVE